jgi:arylsulfatase A-like enzyme
MNALVLQTSGLHLGYLGCYGNEWVATPYLDQLATQSVVFDQHFADDPGGELPSNWTGRSSLPLPDGEPVAASPTDLASFLGPHGVRVVRIGTRQAFGQAHTGSLAEWEASIQAVRKTLPKLAREQRWLLWVELPSLTPPWCVPDESLGPYFPPGPQEEGAEPLTPWLDPPAGPCAGDEQTWQRVQNTYAAAVTYLDEQLGLLGEHLDHHGLTDKLLLCLTADRGLALLEHGVIGECRPWLHDELVHLPLLLRLPGAAEAGRRIFALTQPVDLVPTLLGALEVPVPETLHGHDLLPLARGEVERVRPYACTGLRHGDRLEWSLRTLDWAFLLPIRLAVDDPPRGAQLYVKPDDRWEVNNLIQQHLELTEKAETTLRAYAAATHQPGKLILPPLEVDTE